MKYLSFFIILILIMVELGLILLPIGPIESYAKYSKNVKKTERAGLRPCVSCGKPADTIEYKSTRGDKAKVKRYCTQHAPSSLDSFSTLIEEKPVRLITGSVIVFGIFIYSLRGLRIINERAKDMENMDFVVSKYLKPQFLAFAFYIFISLVFFWGGEIF